MNPIPHRNLTEAEYLAIERQAQFKSEYFNGEMFPMQDSSGPPGPLGTAGARFEHDVIK
jgi:hypothetical protein